jgi:hypothetical protein
MAANDVIGKIEFQAPDEGTGTDAVLVSAAIQAVAEGDFSSSSNATSLQFMTGSSEAAAEKMTLTSGGTLNIGGDTNAAFGPLQIGNTSDNHAYIQQLSSVAGNIHFGDATSGDARFIGSIVYRHDTDLMKFQTNGAVGLQIDSAGHVTKPLNTAFKTTQTGALSVADGHTLFSGNTTEVKDLNADLSGATFTAPVDGFYYISASILYQDIGSSATDTIEDTFVFSNGNEIISRAGKLNNALVSGGYFMSNNATVSFMDANDTVICRHDDGGTLVVHPNAHATHFEGYLLG